MYRAVRRGYALVALGPHLSEAEANFQCFNTTWPPEHHRELPEVGSPDLASCLLCPCPSGRQLPVLQHHLAARAPPRAARGGQP